MNTATKFQFVMISLVFATIFASNDCLVFAQTAGEKFKNVNVLTAIPAEHMGKVMNMMSASLGVNCSYCHEGTNFAKENVGHKDDARKMLTMTLGINNAHFEGKPSVSCYTCHRGNTNAASTIPLDSTTATKALPSHPASQSTVEAVLQKHIEALGGREKLESIKTRHIVAQRVEPNGQSEPEELWQTSGGQSRMVTKYGKVAVVEVFDGKETWKSVNDRMIDLKLDEVEQIRREALVAWGLNLESIRSMLEYKHVEQIGDRNAHLIARKTAGNLDERLYFDVESGLLIRRICSVPTVLGAFEYQVEYNDYQVMSDFLQPTKIRFAVPNITWTRQVIAVEINPNINSTLFQKP
ncbi:MAG: photosynthetic reaction center cytochrome c subunit family protein [Planctomycetota bacterium]|nr:photosynthetic reaction center cytochrome c subunit family protein [Planctomycetota bacterium]